MIEIQVKPGINTVGNYTVADIPAVKAFVDANIHNAKTLKDKKWVSWDKGSPELFNGFNDVESCRGYVVNARKGALVYLEDDYVADIYDVPAILGDNMLCVPLQDVDVTETNKRFSANVYKKVINNRWVSFTKGSPVAFQGFLKFDENQGYFVKVTEVFPDKRGSYLPDVLRYILGRDSLAETTRVRFLDRVEPGLRISFYQKNKI